MERGTAESDFLVVDPILRRRDLVDVMSTGLEIDAVQDRPRKVTGSYGAKEEGAAIAGLFREVEPVFEYIHGGDIGVDLGQAPEEELKRGGAGQHFLQFHQPPIPKQRNDQVAASGAHVDHAGVLRRPQVPHQLGIRRGDRG